MMQSLIAPSILAADFANLQQDVELVNNSQADWFHIDIMDGVFVPNISFGMPVLKAIAKHAKKILDVHLMIVEPERYIKTFAELGSNVLTVHFEACKDLTQTIMAIKDEGMKAGVAINPDSSIYVLEPFIAEIDLVCLMSVQPGFGGQSFIEGTYEKIQQLKELIHKKGAATKIEVDGGVTAANAKKLNNLGADVLVTGSFVFKSEDPYNTIADLKQLSA
ncbi:MAG: ribulose-phosphate 3-epimerase [Bacteroidota bacterium]|nr:ribulose-phosphate 3-epimerase [Bacteroidota bacterium]